MASTLNDRQRKVTLGILVGAWLIMVVPVAAAQEVDSRWVPWVGCWRAVDETDTAPLLCVVPLAGEEAVEMLTVLDGQVVSREAIFTDGQQHEVSRDDCEGWEGAEFSSDSRRIYIRSELNCGAGGVRTSTGVLSMVSPFEWLDVRTMDVDGQSVPWALRYRLASRADFQSAGQGDLVSTQGSAVRMSRIAASVPIALDDVIEAAEKVSAETVQLWVVERGDPFALDAGRLIEVADAGVPANVIDVLVAVSYPEKFVVNEGVPSGRPETGRRGVGYARGLNPFDDPFYDPYSRYGYYSSYGTSLRYGFGNYGRYGYGPFGYGYGGYGYGYGGYGYGYGGYGSPIIVVGRRGTGASSGPTSGQVVRGGGYTSARGSNGSTGRSAQPRYTGSSGRAAPSRGSARSRSSGGGAAARSSGGARRSSGSSGQSTGRRAQPRGRN